jgi:hypothetical protein
MNYGMDIFFHIDEFIKEKNLPWTSVTSSPNVF